MSEIFPADANPPPRNRVPSAIERWLVHPYEARAGLLLENKHVRLQLVGRSWAHRHALLAAFDHTEMGGACPKELGDDFVRLRIGAFMKKWCGRSPPGALSIMNRLGQRDTPATGAYVWLLDIMQYGGQAARTLRHDKAISFERIIQFSRLPDWLCVPDLPGPDLLPLASLSSLTHFVEDLDRAGTMHRDGLLRRIVRWADDPRALAEFDEELEQAFPAPLIADSNKLRFLSTEAQVLAVRKRFGNCLRASRSERLGTSALYVWEGAEPAVVRVQHVIGRPVVTEALGANNRPVSVSTHLAIADHVSELISTEGNRE